MKTLIAFTLAAVALVLFIFFSPAFAAADGVTVAPLHLDFSPLIPVINGLIVAVAGILSASVPLIVGYLVYWMRQHGIALSQGAQKIMSDRIGATIQNGLKFAQAGADAGISKLKVDVSDPNIAAAANYAIAQSPELLKKAGIDVTTEEGQKTLIRRIIAEASPPAPNQPAAVDVNLKTS